MLTENPLCTVFYYTPREERPKQGSAGLALWAFSITETGYIPTPSDFASAENLKPGVPIPGLILVSPEKLYEHC